MNANERRFACAKIANAISVLNDLTGTGDDHDPDEFVHVLPDDIRKLLEDSANKLVQAIDQILRMNED